MIDVILTKTIIWKVQNIVTYLNYLMHHDLFKIDCIKGDKFKFYLGEVGDFC